MTTGGAALRGFAGAWDTFVSCGGGAFGGGLELQALSTVMAISTQVSDVARRSVEPT
ncbi:MAG: hypothetical protein JWL58_566 [Streptosporangiaceae bacterium]|jgi:hypothetical protein|nr:hypothetical protein [Streptosporangiaceae bacterium]